MHRKGTMRGFSLVELLVVVGLVGVITTVIVFNYRKYESQSVIAQAAQEVDLAIREAQVSASSGRELPGEGCDGFSLAYGIHIEDGDNNFEFFAEAPANCSSINSNSYSYTSNGARAIPIRTVPLKTGFFVSDLHASTNGTTFSNNISDLNIVFGSGKLAPVLNKNAGVNYEIVKIELSSPQGEKRYVIIDGTGRTYINKSGDVGALNRPGGGNGNGNGNGGDGEEEGEGDGKGGEEQG